MTAAVRRHRAVPEWNGLDRYRKGNEQMGYLSVEEAKTASGLRLVLSRNTPGPWGEAAKNVFDLKHISYTRVSQYPGQPNEALKAWTGHSNAPIAIYNDEPPCSTWSGILLLAERLQPLPALIPCDEAERSALFGLCHEICGEDGLNWNRRLMLIGLWDQVGTAEDAAFRHKLKTHYGHRPEAVARAGSRVRAIFAHLADCLREQRRLGKNYLVGDQLSAADIHLATALALFKPLPEEHCPMDASIRALYSHIGGDTLAALDSILIEHRDSLYEKHLPLPLDL